ncbi:alpha/beta hydrolase-fold protein [Flavobacterium johnsoniae]|uniref:alpha/beta hydrolase n=1 Tax=Flavobacterium johnsoniae TaxID=986 RepID=UPI0025B05DFF|nr:alpha/beta hydrolase-fold protein [Flavobacterium johnsoniae]WJS96878.1 alpha/beta hydrolase-fold protein [Flavobacterium johnsoniae]
MKRIFLAILFLITLIGKAQESTASKNVTTFTIEAPQLHTSKKIWIYLPENYSKETQKRYSVIYMHDAQNLFDAKTSYSGEWNVDEKLDSLKAPVIVVGIEHGNEKRIEELTPFKNEKYGGGNADNYLEFIVKTLKPHIDKNYRTKTKPKNTILFGSSLGGLFSFYGALKYPEVFGKAGVFSPSFWFSNDIYTFTEKQSKIKTKIYFLCGDKESDDMVNDLTKMKRLLDTKRCYCLHLDKIKIVKDGEHNEKLWRDNFAQALLWLGY